MEKAEHKISEKSEGASRKNSVMIDELCALLAGINDAKDCKTLLEDLCTYKEIEQMAQRARAAKLLKQGRTYSEIIAETEISSATLSRVSRCLHHGSGGYERFIE